MNQHRIQDFVDRALQLVPIPPEAYPPGVINRTPGVRSLVELAWQNMAILVFLAGTVFGLMIAILLLLAVVLKTSIPAMLRAIANAH